MTMPMMQPPALLGFGQRGPNFGLPSVEGRLERFYDRFIGNLMVLVFYPSQAHPAALPLLCGFAERREALAAAGAAVVAVSRDSVAANAALRSSQGLGFPLYSDPEGVVMRAYGALDAGADVTAYLMDRNQRVLAVFQDLEDFADQVLAHLHEGGFASLPGRAVALQAPVLLVPNVFDPALCARAIEAWGGNNAEGAISVPERAYAQTAAVKPSGAVYRDLKRRLDHVADDGLNPVLMKAAMSRLKPELFKAFHFHIGRLERFCIGAYAAERGDFFRPHRDNITEKTKDRCFAASIALNDDYDGGGVKFAEFSEDVYDPPVGGALVFSCSLLHEAMPVTRGTRFAAFTFFYAPAQDREAGPGPQPAPRAA